MLALGPALAFFISLCGIPTYTSDVSRIRSPRDNSRRSIYLITRNLQQIEIYARTESRGSGKIIVVLEPA